MIRICSQCGAVLLDSEFDDDGTVCGYCQEDNQRTLEAHDAMYGDQEREMEQERRQRYEDEREEDGMDDGWIDASW